MPEVPEEWRGTPKVEQPAEVEPSAPPFEPQPEPAHSMDHNRFATKHDGKYDFASDGEEGADFPKMRRLAGILPSKGQTVVWDEAKGADFQVDVFQEVPYPLGALPRNWAERKRAEELARTLHTYLNTPAIGTNYPEVMLEWIDEIREIVARTALSPEAFTEARRARS